MKHSNHYAGLSCRCRMAQTWLCKVPLTVAVVFCSDYWHWWINIIWNYNAMLGQSSLNKFAFWFFNSRSIYLPAADIIAQRKRWWSFEFALHESLIYYIIIHYKCILNWSICKCNMLTCIWIKLYLPTLSPLDYSIQMVMHGRICISDIWIWCEDGYVISECS